MISAKDYELPINDDMREAIEKWKKYQEESFRKPNPCPDCGRCPTCGRRDGGWLRYADNSNG